MTLPPPRRPFSVSRQLSERARAVAQANAAQPGAQPAVQSDARSADGIAGPGGFSIAGLDGITGMVGALRGLVEQLKETAQQHGSADQAAPDTAGHSGSLSAAGGKARMVFGYTLKMGADGISAEPFGNVPTASTGRARPVKEAGVAPAPLQPIVEVYQDGASVVVIAELPGADPARIVCRADGARLLIEASGARTYRKELTLPVAVQADGIVQRLQNGILEVRLTQAATP